MWFSCLDAVVFNRNRANTYALENGSMLLAGRKIEIDRPCSYTSVRGHSVPIVTLSAEPPTRTSDRVFVYFHGRGEDMGSLVHDGVLPQIADATGCSVVAFEYPGYGYMDPSQVCMEDTIRAGHALYEHLSKTSPVIVYGYSIGSGIAMEALRRASAAPGCVFLEGAFPTLLTSTHARGKPLCWLARLLGIDVLETRGHLPGVPTYFIHGTDDEMCSAADAQRMARAAGTYETSLWLRGRGHCDARSDPRYGSFMKETVENL